MIKQKEILDFSLFTAFDKLVFTVFQKCLCFIYFWSILVSKNALLKKKAIFFVRSLLSFHRFPLFQYIVRYNENGNWKPVDSSKWFFFVFTIVVLSRFFLASNEQKNDLEQLVSYFVGFFCCSIVDDAICWSLSTNDNRATVDGDNDEGNNNDDTVKRAVGICLQIAVVVFVICSTTKRKKRPDFFTFFELKINSSLLFTGGNDLKISFTDYNLFCYYRKKGQANFLHFTDSQL